MNYMQDKDIDCVCILDYIRGERIEFKMYDYDVSVKVTDKLTLESFLSDANSQYLEHLKRRRDFYKSMLEGFEAQVKDFKPVLY